MKLVYQIQRVFWHIKQIMPKNVKYKEIHYSQEGEDINIDRLLGYKKEGFYIDIGCYHPFQYSNTYLFYKKGWNGINVDAKKETIDLFQKHRKRDINLNVGVGEKLGQLEYFMFKAGAENTFSKERAQEMIDKDPTGYLGSRIVEVQSLSQILENNLPESQEIDFMDIDVEGLDLEVLKSNDWNRFRPHYLLVEIDGTKELKQVVSDEVVNYMETMQYSAIGKFLNTLLLVDACYYDR